MCLAIPGKILSAEDSDGTRTARVQFGGIVREVRLDFVPQAVVGDYVLVHAGFAIGRIDEAEARRIYELLEEMGALEDESPQDDKPAPELRPKRSWVQ
jgi:hydrogenase expression/formation protein HypC